MGIGLGFLDLRRVLPPGPDACAGGAGGGVLPGEDNGESDFDGRVRGDSGFGLCGREEEDVDA